MKTARMLPLSLFLLMASSHSSFSQSSAPCSACANPLTHVVGGRVPGTPAMDQAIEGATTAFREAGGANVHTEKFQIPVSWSEGDTRMWIDAPITLNLRAVSVAWAPALQPIK